MKRRVGAAALVVLGASAATAHGQEAAAPQRVEAEDDFRQALADEEAGAWDKALGEFAQARALAHKETPQLLYHLGLCHAKLGKLVVARGELMRAAELAQAERLENVATTSKALLAEVQPSIALLALTRPARGQVTSVTVDGIDATGKVGTSIELDPGVHQVHVAYAGAPPADLPMTLGGGERRALAIPEPAVAISAVPPAPASAPVSAPAPVAEPPGRTGKTVGWIVIGGAAALAVGGAVFWALRDGAVSTLYRDCGPTGQTCPAADQSVIDRAKVDDALGVSLLVAGSAAVLTGAGLLLFSGPHGSETAVRIAPLVTARGGGLLLEGSLW